MKRISCLLLTVMLLFSVTACHRDEEPMGTDLNTDPATAPVTIPDTFPELGSDVSITCVEGTSGCYSIDGDTILFTGIQADSVYTISGEWTGCIVIDIAEEFKLELEMQGLSLAGEKTNPITVLGGHQVTLTAKKDFDNFIYDKREAGDSDQEGIYAGAIHAECDLVIGGKGRLTVISSNNNGIHTKDDLEVKNLTLTVSCVDNALKGNDSVTIQGGNLNLISRQGDGIKTSNSHISEKGNQRGTITISAATLNIYAACDGMDAAYDVVIEDAATILNIYTDKYSDYSETVEHPTAGSDEDLYYIRFNAKTLNYAVKYYNSDSDYLWVDVRYHSSVSGGRNSYYYYSFQKMSGYNKIQYFGYTSGQTPGQEDDYAFCTDYLTVNTDYDTFALIARGNSLSYNFTNYTTEIDEGFGGGPGGMGGPGGPGGAGGMGGPGGMDGGNSDKRDYSTKGIKAANSILIFAGTISVKAYDDGLHANNDITLENGETPTGDITISGGSITVYSNDDGIHADGNLLVMDGKVRVTNAYEGLEGAFVSVNGGDVSIISKDDGINATSTTGVAIRITGGQIYVYAGGDGLDSNSRESYNGILFDGGNTIVISASNGNSAIDSERGYQHTGGCVLAITAAGGMSGETTNCKNLTEIGVKKNCSLSSGDYVTVKQNMKTVVTVRMPCNVNATVVYLGSNDASISTGTNSSQSLDENGISWAKSTAV